MKKFFRLLLTLSLALALTVSANALTVEQAISLLEENYVDTLSPEVYQAKSLDELFLLLGDDYTFYLSEEEYDSFLNYVESESSVCGIGVSVNLTQNGIEIVTALPGGSAEECGLVNGDLIIAINGVSCAPADDNAITTLKGEPGSFVDVTVLHADGSQKVYHMERREVTVHNTIVSTENGVTTIDCNSFGSNTDQYFAEAVSGNSKNTHMWIVDLRNNSGGVAQSAAYAVGIFSGRGPTLFYRDRAKNCSYHFYTEDAQTTAPVIVLTNGSSASAAEIFAAGIRGTNRGITIGTRTYGKGVAQVILNQDTYPDYFDGDGLKVTAYRFYAADRTTTDRIGVIPTLRVPSDCTNEVAKLLSSPQPAQCDGYLLLKLNGTKFYLNLSDATSENNMHYFEALLSALAPNADVQIGENGEWKNIAVRDLQTRYGVQARTLSDVAACDYDFEISSLVTYGILNGDGDGTFRPKETLTRAELCAMVAQALNVQGRGNYFADVAEDSWYAGSVNAAALLGLVSGDGDGNFNPEDNISYAELITVMGRLAQFLNFGIDLYADKLSTASLAQEYDNLPDWARSYAAVLAKSVTDDRSYPYNMLGTNPAGVNAGEAVTREIAGSTLYRVLRYTGELAY